MTARGPQTSLRPQLPALRAAKTLMLALVGLWAAYAVVAQVLLATPLLRALINRERPAIQVEYRRAWSWWPGRVHIDGLFLTAQDRAVQFQLSVAHADARIQLTQILGRVFHATRIRAQGVSFALRRRLKPRELGREKLPGLPLIEGFGPWPAADEGPEDELPDSRYRLYSIWLEDVEAQGVHQVWVDQIRLEGDAQVAGSFFLKPVRRLQLAGARLRGEGMSLWLAGQSAAKLHDLQVGLTIEPIDPRKLPLARFLAAARGEVRAQAELPSLSFVPAAAAAFISGADVQGARGSGQLKLDARLLQSRWQGSWSLQLREAQLRRGDWALSWGKLEMDGHGVADTGRLGVNIEGGALASGPDAALRAIAGRASASLVPDLLQPGPPRDLALAVRAQLPDAAALARRLGAGSSIQVKRGGGDFQVTLTGAPHALAGELVAHLDDLAGRVADSDLFGSIALTVPLARVDPWRGAELGGTTLSIRGAGVEGSSSVRNWWGDLRLPWALARWAGPTRGLTAGLDAHCRDARPLVGLVGSAAGVPGVLKDLFAMEDLRAHAQLLVRGSGFDLRRLRAQGSGAQIQATVFAHGSARQGAIYVNARGVPVALELDRGGARVQVWRPGDWFNAREQQLLRDPPTSGRPQSRSPSSGSRRAGRALKVRPPAPLRFRRRWRPAAARGAAPGRG